MNCQNEVDHHQELQQIVHHMDTESYGGVSLGRLRRGQLAVGAVVGVLAKKALWVELVVSTVMVVGVAQPVEVVVLAQPEHRQPPAEQKAFHLTQAAK